MDHLEFANFYHEQKLNNPQASNDEIVKLYETQQQGKQAINACLLGGWLKGY